MILQKYWVMPFVKKKSDIGELQLARNIKNGEMELAPGQAEIIKDYVKTGFVAFVQEAIATILE